MGKLSGPRSFFPVEWGMVDLLVKACAHARKTIGVKTMVITSAIFAIGLLNLKKKKRWGYLRDVGMAVPKTTWTTLYLYGSVQASNKKWKKM